MWKDKFISTGSGTYIFVIAFSSCTGVVLVWRRWWHPLGRSSSYESGTGCHSSPGGCCGRSSSACWGTPHCATSGWATSSHTSPGGSTTRRHSPAPGTKNSGLLSWWSTAGVSNSNELNYIFGNICGCYFYLKYCIIRQNCKGENSYLKPYNITKWYFSIWPDTWLHFCYSFFFFKQNKSIHVSFCSANSFLYK